MGVREAFAHVARDTRLRLDLTQEQLARTVGLSRGYIAKVEGAKANPSLALLERIADALGLRLELTAIAPIFLSERRSHDLVRAWCGEAVGRRLQAAGWKVAREVEVSDGRVHAWIDLLALHPPSRTLLIVEIKTRIDDVGALQRQIGWYERHARDAARSLGWPVGSTATWLVGLASSEVERAVMANRSVIDELFPGRALHMLDVLSGRVPPFRGAIALLDPTSRRAAWLIRTRLDGRRSRPRFENYSDAAGRLSAKRR
jgi:transcriptional regulator with XRE-family HTH domain